MASIAVTAEDIPMSAEDWDTAQRSVFAAANAGTIDARQTLALCALILDGQADGEYYCRPSDAHHATSAMVAMAVPADGSDPADGLRCLAGALTWTRTGRLALDGTTGAF